MDEKLQPHIKTGVITFPYLISIILVNEPHVNMYSFNVTCAPFRVHSTKYVTYRPLAKTVLNIYFAQYIIGRKHSHFEI